MLKMLYDKNGCIITFKHELVEVEENYICIDDDLFNELNQKQYKLTDVSLVTNSIVYTIDDITLFEVYELEKAEMELNNEEKIKKLEEENERLKFEQQSQDSFIEVTMMATDEIYMMIEPLLESIQTMSISNNESIEKEVNRMVDFYAAMVIKGLKDVDSVPLRYRDDVKKLLSELEK